MTAPFVDTTGLSFKRPVVVSTLMILVLQVLDLVTTFAVLGKGGIEANPLAAFLLDTHVLGIPLIWYPKMGLPLTILAAAFTRDEQPTLTRVCVGYWVAGFYTMVVVSNTLVYYTK